MVDPRRHLANPPAEPPPQVSSELQWRLAVRLFHEHSLDETGKEIARCLGCGHPWPCSGRRLAELGLIAAVL